MSSRIFQRIVRAKASLLELENKTWVYFLVRNSRQFLGVPSTVLEPFPLLEYLERAYAMSPFASLFAVEGLGRIYAENRFVEGQQPRGLLSEAALKGIRPGAIPMLHAGLGLSFARHALNGVKDWDDPREIEARLDLFVDLVRDNGRADLNVVSQEALGLVAGVFHPSRIWPLHRVIALAQPDLAPAFWHGIGRSIYFVPHHPVIGSVKKVIGRVDHLSRKGGDRWQLFAGFAFALTITNCRSPDVLSELVVKPFGERLKLEPGFPDGVKAAVLMGLHTNPSITAMRRLADFPSSSTRNAHRQDWAKLFEAPVREGRAMLGSDGLRPGAFGEFFSGEAKDATIRSAS